MDLRIKRIGLQNKISQKVLKDLPDDTLEAFLDGDLDLTILEAEGGSINITEEEIIITDVEKTMGILRMITQLDDEAHMKIYKKHGVFHDGGDDLDYGGSFLCGLEEVLTEIINLEGGIK